MIDLQSFTFLQMIKLGATLRTLGESAASMEEVANRTVRFLYDHLRCKEAPNPGSPTNALLAGPAEGALIGKRNRPRKLVCWCASSPRIPLTSLNPGFGSTPLPC